MKIELEEFESGWAGLRIACKGHEIDELIRLLTALRNEQVGHFHCRSLFLENENQGVADIEFSLLGECEVDNAAVG
jgi:hypothetical protein